MVCNFYPSMHTLEVWIVKPLSVVGKQCGYMLSTEFTQVLQLCTLNLCGLHFLSSAFFPSTWGLICCFFSSQGTTNESRSRIYLLNPDPIVMEDWAKEMKEDEDHV